MPFYTKTTKMVPQFLFSFSLILSFLLHCPPTLAQSPAAAPGPPGPTNVTKILEKGGQFSVFIRLLKATQEDVTLNGQLNNTNNAITIFAPSDNAFSSLKSGTLNSLNDQEKAELVQFHIIPQYLSSSQFQTVSNPLTTQAGSGGRLELNVTTTGNSVNITTGLTNTSVSGTIYTDNQLAVYQVDKVLLPVDIFTPKPPTPAPAPEKPKKRSKAAESPDAPEDNSGAESLTVLNNVVFFGVGIVAVIFSL
ncbi:fasciclin-like arabinogalactan protein 12 [Populus nigra]|uniref:fasciclin-like arabinogalactan protein 12 n=1 Tax=Populus nigra TaxID=3691 RepID=UPI002B269398|nr:fasciclin-like arabinogalactan protein 12 [Populus nigra]